MGLLNMVSRRSAIGKSRLSCHLVYANGESPAASERHQETVISSVNVLREGPNFYVLSYLANGGEHTGVLFISPTMNRNTRAKCKASDVIDTIISSMNTSTGGKSRWLRSCKTRAKADDHCAEALYYAMKGID